MCNSWIVPKLTSNHVFNYLPGVSAEITFGILLWLRSAHYIPYAAYLSCTEAGSCGINSDLQLLPSNQLVD